MSRFSHSTWLGLAALLLAGCHAKAPPPAAAAADPGTQVEHLGHIVERYWDENAALTPWYSWGGGENVAPQSLADSLALEQRYLAEVSSVPRSALDARSTLTYDIFRRERMLAIEGFTYPRELLPVNPFDGMPLQFALVGPAAERLALSSAKDFENWRKLALSFVSWTNQATVNMRDGMRRDYTLPRVLVEETLPQLAALGEDTAGNLFYQPLRSATDDAERGKWADAITAVLHEKVLPAYRTLHDFLQHEYLPRSRSSVGLSALPLGDAWYAYLTRRSTGGMTPAQARTLGLAEVERLHQRVQTLLDDASFAGSAQDFADTMRHDPRFSYNTAADLLHAYQDLKAQVAMGAPTVFAGLPRAEFGIRAVEPYREPAASALSYRPRSPNGLAAAVLYVNTAQLALPVDGPAAFLREALPGHHYQMEMQRERTDLPRFRRFGGTPAFIDGWGLYATTLGEELGLYHETQEKFDALLAQLSCAAGLVIDTGLHAYGWTREQALEYLHAQLPIAAAAANEVVDRNIALPAEALACTVGYLKIQGLRLAAQRALDTRFDLRAFHTEVIEDGAVPLDLLETKIKSWVEMVAAKAPDVPADGTATGAGAAGTHDGAGAASASASPSIAPKPD